MTADGRRPACPAFCRSGFCAAPLAPRLPQAHLVLVLLSCSVAHASAGTEEPERELEHVVERPAVAVAYPMLWLFVVLTMGCLVKLLLQKLKEKKNIGIPYSVVLLSLGMFLGALTWTEEASSALPDGEGARERRWHSDSDIWTLSLSSWTEMDPRLILFIFLPALIFEGAASTDYYVFRRQLPGGMLLAFPGMIAQVVLIAVFAIYGFPYGWGWTESLLFGSILSATDPVAVIALMKELGLLSGGEVAETRRSRARVIDATMLHVTWTGN